MDEGAIAQWSADNVDHNIQTLSGKRSLHAMRNICSITAKNPTSLVRTQELKREKVMKVSKICKGKAIQINRFGELYMNQSNIGYAIAKIVVKR